MNTKTSSNYYIDESKLSIICYDTTINKLIVLDKNGMFFGKIEEMFSVNKKSQIRISREAIKKLYKSDCINYETLSEQVKKCGLLHEIQEKKIIVAYDEDISFCELIRYIIRLFGDFYRNVRLIDKMSLAAVYYGSLFVDDDFVFKIQKGNECLYVEAGEGVIEIMDVNDDSLFTINTGAIIEVVGGAIWDLCIKKGYITNSVILYINKSSYEVEVAGKKYKLIEKDTTIPCHRSETIEKGKADKIFFNVDNQKFEWEIPYIFKDDVNLECSADIDVNSIVKFEVKSKDSGKSLTITMQGLLRINN